MRADPSVSQDVIDENYFPVLWRDDGYRPPAIEAYLTAG